MAKRKTTFRVKARGDEWAAVSPEGEELGTFGSQRQAEEYASSYAEVFNILAQDTGQAVRFGTQKAESPEEKQDRIKKLAHDAARQFAQAAENVKDPTFGVPTGTPGTLTKGANLGAQGQLAQQASGPPPTLAQGEATGEGLTASDVRRIIRQEQKRQPKPRRSLAAKMEGGPTPPPHSKPRRQRKKQARKPRQSVGGTRVPIASSEMGAGGFVLEDAPTTLTAFDVTRMLSGQPPSATPSLTSTLDYPAGGQGSLTRAAAATPAAPVSSTPAPTKSPPAASTPVMITRAMRQELLDRGFTKEAIRSMTPEEAHRHLGAPSLANVAGGQPSTAIPTTGITPTNAPQSTNAARPQRARGDSDRRRLAKEIGDAVGKRLDAAVTKLLNAIGKQRKPKPRADQQSKRLADTQKKAWDVLSQVGRAAVEQAHRNDSWLAGLRRLSEQRYEAIVKRKQDKKDRERSEERKKTRTSNRLLEASQKQLKGIFKPFTNAIQNVRNVWRSQRNQRIADLARKFGLDKLGKAWERESRAFAARIARGGGGRGLFGSAARGFVPGLAGRVGLGAGRAGAAGIGAGGAAAEAGAGGALGAAGAVVGTELGATLVGAAAGAALFSAGLALATKAAVDFTKHTKSAGRERLESQREFARLNAGIATTFANLDRATFLRDFQRAAQTSASVDLLGRSQVRLQNDTAGFGTAVQTLHNVFRSTLNDVVAAALERSGLAQFGQVAAMLADLYARWRGGNPGPVGHPALRFLDDVARGNFKSPPAPKNKAPQKPGKI